VEDVFERDVDFAAAPDVFPPDKFNAGVLLIVIIFLPTCPKKPSLEKFDELLTKPFTAPSYDGGDTGFLNFCFPNWFCSKDPQARLPFGYNAQRILHWFTFKRTDGYWKAVEPLKIIHYSSSPKPWVGAPKGDLEMLWY